jgi:hypothetical protein
MSQLLENIDNLIAEFDIGFAETGGIIAALTLLLTYIPGGPVILGAAGGAMVSGVIALLKKGITLPFAITKAAMNIQNKRKTNKELQETINRIEADRHMHPHSRIQLIQLATQLSQSLNRK